MIYSWDETFMGIAQVVSGRSKDPSTKVGAAIVTTDNRILSVGYNGAPLGFNDDNFPWGKSDPDPLNNKYLYVVHAERNAILNFRGVLREMGQGTIYVTHFPCNECAKEIIQVGIKEVVYLNPHDIDSLSTLATIRMFDQVGINYRQLDNILDQSTFKR